MSADLRYSEETEAAMREAREIAAGLISAARYGSAAVSYTHLTLPTKLEV